MIAIPREDGGLTIIGSMQCPFYIVKALTPMLGNDRMNVVQAATGGGFGVRKNTPMLAARASLLALKTGKLKMIIAGTRIFGRQQSDTLLRDHSIGRQ